MIISYNFFFIIFTHIGNLMTFLFLNFFFRILFKVMCGLNEIIFHLESNEEKKVTASLGVSSNSLIMICRNYSLFHKLNSICHIIVLLNY